MILATRYDGNKQLERRFGADTSRAPVYGGFGWPSAAREIVSSHSASGLSAVGRAIRLVSGLVASLPLSVFEGERASRKELPDSPQAKLFANPVAGMSDYDWRYDIASSLETCENSYLLKVKDSRGVIVELYPVPVDCVHGYSDDRGRKVFEVWTAGGLAKMTSSQILHVRGQTLGGGLFGVSRIEQHRDPLGSQLAAQRFEGAYFKNHARPDVALLFPEKVTQQQASEWRDFWTSQYGGAGNAGQAVPLGGGADIKPIPSSMRDAQFIESKGLGVREVGRIMDVESALLDIEADGPTKEAALEAFLRLQFITRLRRIERAFKADLDLFGLTDQAYPAFVISEMIFTDALTRAQIQHEQIQDGRRLVDEIRAEDGLPPLPPVPADWTQEPGKVPQITPVGGAANPTAETAPDEPDEDDVREPRGFTVPSVELRVEQDMEPLAREMGLAFSSMADALGKFTAMASDLQERAATIDDRREFREVERAKKADALAEAHAKALRELGSPQVVVNVEPTPVTIENVVNVPEQQVHVQLEMPHMPEPAKTITVKRNPKTGLIESATVEED